MYRLAPAVSAGQISTIEASKAGLATWVARSSGLIPSSCRYQAITLCSPARVSSVPFGRPVEPEV
jgi:hypothetical protein